MRYGRFAQSAEPVQPALVDELKFMLEEEKLARDVYLQLAEDTDLFIFSQIAASEQKHMDTLVRQAERFHIDVDDILVQEVGDFINPDLAILYTDLLTLDTQDVTQALQIGVMIETLDIEDLTANLQDPQLDALDQVFANLLQGSYQHLDAFNLALA
ncbi:hypothetical protein SAMN05421831_102251 [Allopseudospirillum japonicum]|uniref:DUF2202 domain-containing protein n=1 Tax=Allopseudospirillum japonicum TaxID=64971 RepID=A0A1H6R5K6_9GAMM|nr:DUF2202 domain-containing protein [Allopseudospirillum japonicum]SEI47797.1 hypothetical protein SAMN05421831_102251 [Allopseudospirillum japonicum]